MIRIKLPFQFKIYILIFITVLLLLNLTSFYTNTLLSSKTIEAKTEQFVNMRTLFYSMLRLKIRSLEEEAELLSEQTNIKKSLAMWDEGFVDPVLKIFPSHISQRRDLLLVSDSAGNILDGFLRLTDHAQTRLLVEPEQLKPLFPIYSIMQDILFGYHSARFIRFEQEGNTFFFAFVSAPVFSDTKPVKKLGAVMLGFPINATLFQELRTGADFEIAFVFGDEIAITSFQDNRKQDFRQAWDRIPQSRRIQLLDKPRTIRLFDEPYLAAASPLPLAQKGQGFYVIMTSLENTYTFLSTFKQSVFWTSLLILCGVLLLAYILSRGITAPVRRLSDAVSLISEGRYDVEIPIKTGDEIEQLAQRVSNLAHKLRKRNDEVKRYVTRIENWNKELEKSVQERTTDLKEKNLRLQVISKELGRAYEKIDEELKTVGDMQKNLLPPDTVNIKGVKIHTFYYPNGRAGGDYYDIIKTGKNQVFILMADVSGHGIPAAFIMGMTRAMAHTLIEKGSSPSEVLLSLSNILLKTIRRGEFVTMFLARLDLRKQELVFSSAGHPPPLFFHPQVPQFSELSVKQGVPLGIMENPVYEEIPIPFHAEDRLFLYTDGLVEAFDEQKNTYSLERIKGIMKNNIQMNPEGVIELAIRDLESHIGKPLDLVGLEDDVTIMIVQFPYVESLAG